MSANKCIAILAVLLTLIVAFWAVVHAADEPGGSVPQPKLVIESCDILRGLRGILVMVEPSKPDVEPHGLTKEALQTDTELQLRQYGIEVVSRREWANRPGMPCLFVRTIVFAAPDGSSSDAVASVGVHLYEQVSLVRDPAVRCFAATWVTDGLWSGPPAKLAEGTRKIAKDLVAKLINEYLAANPKQPAPTQEDRGSEAKQG